MDASQHSSSSGSATPPGCCSCCVPTGFTATFTDGDGREISRLVFENGECVERREEMPAGRVPPPRL